MSTKNDHAAPAFSFSKDVRSKFLPHNFACSNRNKYDPLCLGKERRAEQVFKGIGPGSYEASLVDKKKEPVFR